MVESEPVPATALVKRRRRSSALRCVCRSLRFMPSSCGAHHQGGKEGVPKARTRETVKHTFVIEPRFNTLRKCGPHEFKFRMRIKKSLHDALIFLRFRRTSRIKQPASCARPKRLARESNSAGRSTGRTVPASDATLFLDCA